MTKRKTLRKARSTTAAAWSPLVSQRIRTGAKLAAGDHQAAGNQLSLQTFVRSSLLLGDHHTPRFQALPGENALRTRKSRVDPKKSRVAPRFIKSKAGSKP